MRAKIQRVHGKKERGTLITFVAPRFALSASISSESLPSRWNRSGLSSAQVSAGSGFWRRAESAKNGSHQLYSYQVLSAGDRPAVESCLETPNDYSSGLAGGCLWAGPETPKAGLRTLGGRQYWTHKLGEFSAALAAPFCLRPTLRPPPVCLLSTPN